MNVPKIAKCLAGLAAMAALASPCLAGNLSEEFSKCVTKYARSTQAATVTLECKAADGKVSDCKVTDGPLPRNGFDQAALCVSQYLPVGNKTGSISFPIRFEPGHY